MSTKRAQHTTTARRKRITWTEAQKQIRQQEALYHGIFERLGLVDTARCVDCHWNHLVLGTEDPAASIHPSRLTQTCGVCHEGASENFVLHREHLLPRSDTEQPLFYATA